MPTVEAVIAGELDRIAAGRQAQQDAFATGDDFWDRVYSSGDQVFIDYVLGNADTSTDLGPIAAIDAVLLTGGEWSTSKLKQWFTRHENYIRMALDITTAPLLQTYLATYSGKRVPFLAAEAYYEAIGIRLGASRVFAKGTLVADESNPAAAGMHKFGRFTPNSTYNSTDGALPSTVIGAPVVAINQSGSQTVAGTFTFTLQDATTKNIALSLSGVAQYKQTVMGAQAVASGAAAGQKDVSVAATAQFKAGEWVLIWESDSLQEVAQIDSVTTNSKLTMKSNLINSYTTAAAVWPLFTNVAFASGGSGSGNVDFYARPDRIVAV